MTNSDLPNSFSTSSSAHQDHTSRRGSLTSENVNHDSGDVEDDFDYEDNAEPETSQDEAAADDFDNFAEEQELADDDFGDFGDFDDGFQELDGETAEPEPIEPQQPLPSPSAVSSPLQKRIRSGFSIIELFLRTCMLTLIRSLL